MKCLTAIILLLALTLSSCKKVETTENIGHKGKARINPYLAAERLLEAFDEDVPRQYGWPKFDEDEISTAFIPASALTSEGYVRDLESWIYSQGHAVIFLQGGEFFLNDWSEFYSPSADFSETLTDWLEGEGLTISDGSDLSEKISKEKITFEGQSYEVWSESESYVRDPDTGSPAAFVSIPRGEGRLTLVADARMFRNRHIDDYDHAALLVDLVDRSPYYGSVVFVRNASVSFFGLLWSQGWPAMFPLILLTIFWLWKNLPRFQPLGPADEPDTNRSQTHQLAAIGSFHWKLNHGQHLLSPIRHSLRDRTHALMVSSGQTDADIFEVMATRADISRERAQRAMTDEQAHDQGSFTRLVADLQRIHQAIS